MEGGKQEEPCHDIDFTTLGMFIIDEIEFLPPRPPVRDVLGGGGAYAALGARLFSPPPLSKTVGWIIDQGSDFPESITATINSWLTTAVFRPSKDRLTTRAWNGYVDASERRAFKYTTPKIRLTADDLAANPALLQARAIHMVCSPTRCRELVGDIQALRKEAANPPESYVKPFIIWEPVPDLCVPEELLNLTNTLPLVDVCSPNHAELAGFMGGNGLDPATGRVDAAAVERGCEQLLASMPSQAYTLVVRAGERGCFVARNGGRKREPKKKKRNLIHGGLQHDTDMEALFAGLLGDDGSVSRAEIEVDPGLEKWFPAYYGGKTASDALTASSDVIVDPTGAGNTFLGGLAVAMARGKPIDEACAWATVAASFALEQVGMPSLGSDGEGNETWNGVRVEERLKEYQSRL